LIEGITKTNNDEAKTVLYYVGGDFISSRVLDNNALEDAMCKVDDEELSFNS
jgi:hypothetical protein